MVEKDGNGDWDSKAERLGTGRTGESCRTKYLREPATGAGSPRSGGSPASPKPASSRKTARAAEGSRSRSRSPAPAAGGGRVKRIKTEPIGTSCFAAGGTGWGEQEVQKLRKIVHGYGTAEKSWEEVAAKMGTKRGPSAYRMRWNRLLKGGDAMDMDDAEDEAEHGATASRSSRSSRSATSPNGMIDLGKYTSNTATRT